MIEFSHVSKLFGTQKAVNDLNLNFQEVFGADWYIRLR